MALIVLLSGDMGSHPHAVRVVSALVGKLWPGLGGCEVSEARVYDVLLALRKPAHVLLYGVLALLSHNFLRAATRLRRAWRHGVALAWCLAWAVFDETHQAIAGTRTPLITDVGLDVLAAATALLIVRMREDAADRRRRDAQDATT